MVQLKEEKILKRFLSPKFYNFIHETTREIFKEKYEIYHKDETKFVGEIFKEKIKRTPFIELFLASTNYESWGSYLLNVIEGIDPLKNTKDTKELILYLNNGQKNIEESAIKRIFTASEPWGPTLNKIRMAPLIKKFNDYCLDECKRNCEDINWRNEHYPGTTVGECFKKCAKQFCFGEGRLFMV